MIDQLPRYETILCNLCGESCNLDSPPWDQPQGLIEASVVGGYPSTPGNGCGTLDDGDGFKFSLCEFCVDWLFSQFKIPPIPFDPHEPNVLREGETVEEGIERIGIGCLFITKPPPPSPWLPAEERVKRDDWRKMKKEFFERKAIRDKARERS